MTIEELLKTALDYLNELREKHQRSIPDLTPASTNIAMALHLLKNGYSLNTDIDKVILENQDIPQR